MATDKRLDQVSTLTDFDYALIVKGDQVAKASKQQLAELVGNLLYGATNASSLATVVAEQNHITIGSNAGLRVSYNKTYDTSYYPAAHGSVLRVGDNTQSGIGFELFFGYGGGLWNKNEGDSTWKKIL